ncbi:MAG: AzlC family ABC transporter permease [Ruminiclostridium sp.]
MRVHFLKGLYHGIPIALGYLSVSFGFGIMAVKAGLSILAAVGISVTNLTSAGQAAGVAIIAAGGSYIEMALTQLVINIRYSLMGLSLSQRLDKSFTTPHRLMVSFGITDEIFAVASAQPGRVTPWYMYGLILIAFLGWSGGTLLGAAAGQFLPAEITDAMGIVLYGMFLAIIIPPARKEKSVLTAVVIAALFSILFNYLLTAVSPGFAVIISAIAASAVAALLFPVEEEEEEQE